MKRFFGMMPTNEIEKEVTYKAKGIMFDVRIIIQAGPNGWTVIWPDKGTNYKDETHDTETNFNTAYELAKKTYPDMVEDTETIEECDCCEECDEECDDNEENSEDISELLPLYNKLVEDIMERISQDWAHIIDYMLNRFPTQNGYKEYINNPENKRNMTMIDRFVYESYKFEKLLKVKSYLDSTFLSRILSAFTENWNALKTINDAKIICSDMQECINMYDMLNTHDGDAIKMCLHDHVSAPLSIISNAIMYAYDTVTEELEYVANFSTEIILKMDLGTHSDIYKT